MLIIDMIPLNHHAISFGDQNLGVSVVFIYINE